jgi:hypothetical protein
VDDCREEPAFAAGAVVDVQPAQGPVVAELEMLLGLNARVKGERSSVSRARVGIVDLVPDLAVDGNLPEDAGRGELEIHRPEVFPDELVADPLGREEVVHLSLDALVPLERDPERSAGGAYCPTCPQCNPRRPEGDPGEKLFTG